jgi:hypothetical protein
VSTIGSTPQPSHTNHIALSPLRCAPIDRSTNQQQLNELFRCDRQNKHRKKCEFDYVCAVSSFARAIEHSTALY